MFFIEKVWTYFQWTCNIYTSYSIIMLKISAKWSNKFHTHLWLFIIKHKRCHINFLRCMVIYMLKSYSNRVHNLKQCRSVKKSTLYIYIYYFYYIFSRKIRAYITFKGFSVLCYGTYILYWKQFLYQKPVWLFIKHWKLGTGNCTLMIKCKIMHHLWFHIQLTPLTNIKTRV
jgi:hypothetical protein